MVAFELRTRRTGFESDWAGKKLTQNDILLMNCALTFHNPKKKDMGYYSINQLEQNLSKKLLNVAVIADSMGLNLCMHCFVVRADFEA